MDYEVPSNVIFLQVIIDFRILFGANVGQIWSRYSPESEVHDALIHVVQRMKMGSCLTGGRAFLTIDISLAVGLVQGA